MLFTNAHCAASACNPSRTSLFTGIRPSISGIYYKRQHWRYIRYHDGSEELYDHQIDPDEYTNPADQEEYTEVKKDLATWLSRINQPPIELKE